MGKKLSNGIMVAVLLFSACCAVYSSHESEEFAGPYSSAKENSNSVAIDAGIPGFVGPAGRGICPPGENDQQVDGGGEANYVNPVFRQWACGWYDYLPAAARDKTLIGNEQYSPAGGVPQVWRKPDAVLGAVTGDNFDVCVLGDLWADQIAVLTEDHPDYLVNLSLAYDDPNRIAPGQITLLFDPPIQNGPGPDFAVFENGFISAGGAGVAGQIFAELAYVEVSSDGQNFVRFPCVSLTDPGDGGTGAYGTIDPSEIYNLAGKHVNAYEKSWGTPFNLSDVAGCQMVSEGIVNLDSISYVRIVDIPGSGFFADSASQVVDPNTIDPATGQGGSCYPCDHGIYDAWVTWGSGGFDLEAVGAIEQIYGDANSDGSVDLIDFTLLASRWKQYGNWPQGDFDENRFVDERDLLLLAENWLMKLQPFAGSEMSE